MNFLEVIVNLLRTLLGNNRTFLKIFFRTNTDFFQNIFSRSNRAFFKYFLQAPQDCFFSKHFSKD